MESREKTGTKTRKLIWDGELVNVSTLYQLATIGSKLASSGSKKAPETKPRVHLWACSTICAETEDDDGEHGLNATESKHQRKTHFGNVIGVEIVAFGIIKNNVGWR